MNENENESVLDKLTAKFTKANMYAVLKDFNTEDTEITMDEIIAAVKPQKGGGASENPSKEIDGVMSHWCRYKNEYRPESEFVLSDGKSKGASALASKVAYRIGKAAAELEAKAMKLFRTGNYEDANVLLADKDTLIATVEDPFTFTDKAMAESKYHPDFGKEKKASTAEVETNNEEL